MKIGKAAYRYIWIHTHTQMYSRNHTNLLEMSKVNLWTIPRTLAKALVETCTCFSFVAAHSHIAPQWHACAKGISNDHSAQTTIFCCWKTWSFPWVWHSDPLWLPHGIWLCKSLLVTVYVKCIVLELQNSLIAPHPWLLSFLFYLDLEGVLSW